MKSKYVDYGARVRTRRLSPFALFAPLASLSPSVQLAGLKPALRAALVGAVAAAEGVASAFAPWQACLAQSGGYLQGDTNSTMVQGGMSSSMVQGNIEHSGDPVNIIFLVDASYSMKEKFGGGGGDRKMNAAKQVLEQALTRIPADVNLGLRVFGQTFSGVPGIDCRQTALLVALGAHNRNGLIQSIRTIQPSGLTPLEYALRQAAEVDFAGAVGSKLIILISDGRDTCDGDPCRFISLLPRYGIKLKVDVVGLLIHDKVAQEQLHCIAEASGGKYYDANSAGELIQSVSKSVDKAISGKVIVKTKTPPVMPPSSTDPAL